MFKPMRRKDKELSVEEAKRILTEGEYGVLSLNGDAYPYGVPVSYVFSDNAVFIHCADKGYKLDLLRADNHVCFTVSQNIKTIADKFTVFYESALLFGQARLLEEEEKRSALITISEKYSKPYMEAAMAEIEIYFDHTAIIRIDIDHITGKKSVS